MFSFYQKCDIFSLDMVEEEDFEVGRMYPPLYKIRQCSIKIASDICKTAYQDKTAGVYPEPDDKNDFITKQLYDYDYDGVSALPPRYPWPEHVTSPMY
jgi:malate dehydrogenase (oxaloacetate-decarboxylating)(NADP+)